MSFTNLSTKDYITNLVLTSEMNLTMGSLAESSHLESGILSFNIEPQATRAGYTSLTYIVTHEIVTLYYRDSNLSLSLLYVI